MENKFCVVFITAPSLEEGKKIATGLVDAKLAACINLVPHIESVYRWEGKIEAANEVLLVAKTTMEKFKKLETWVKAHHSYTVPEIITLPITAGSSPYLQWLQESLF